MQKPKRQIDIETILTALAQFDEVKHHFLTAGIELFKGFSKFITLLMEQLQNLDEKGGLDILKNIKSTLETILPWSAEERANQIVASKRGEILKSIISVLDLEMKKVDDAEDERSQMKYEVLDSIRGVIQKELKKGSGSRKVQNSNKVKKATSRKQNTKKTEPKITRIRKVCME